MFEQIEINVFRRRRNKGFPTNITEDISSTSITKVIFFAVSKSISKFSISILRIFKKNKGIEFRNIKV